MRHSAAVVLGIAAGLMLTSPAISADRKEMTAARAKIAAMARQQGFEAMSDSKLKNVSGDKSGPTDGDSGARVENLSITEAARSGRGTSRPDTSASRHSVPELQTLRPFSRFSFGRR